MQLKKLCASKFFMISIRHDANSIHFHDFMSYNCMIEFVLF